LAKRVRSQFADSLSGATAVSPAMDSIGTASGLKFSFVKAFSWY
jgi:hypothetical protein